MELFTHLWAGLQNLIGIRPVLVVVAGVIVGILGGFIGGNVLGWLGINWGTTILGQIVTAVIGAVILLWVVSLFKKK